MAEKPVTRISLPTHHPAVSGCKNGGCVTIVARKKDSDGDYDKMAMGGKVSPAPPPITTDFHVESIRPVGTAVMPRGKVKSPLNKKPSGVDYLKSKQAVEVT